MRTLILGLTIFLSGCAGGMLNTYNLPDSDSDYLDSLQTEPKEKTINLTEELKKPFTYGDPKTCRKAAPDVNEGSRMENTHNNPCLDSSYLHPLPREREEVTPNPILELIELFRSDGYRVAPGIYIEYK